LGIGGTERQLVALAKGLDKRIFDVTMVYYYGGGELVTELVEAGVPMRLLNKRGRSDLVWFPAQLIQLLWSLQPQILYSFLTVPNLFAVLLKPLFKTTRIVWGIRASYMDPRHDDWLAKVTSWLETRLSRFPDLIIFNSMAGRDHHISAGFTGRSTAVISNGVDTKYFAPNRAEGARIRRVWQLPEDSLVIGIVGRLDPMKDHHTFLRAAAILGQSRPETRFVCVGGGGTEGYARELKSFADRLGLHDKVIWTGSVNHNMSAIYNALDICCSSSYGEGMSNAVAEAMACGVPCVVTDVGDSRLIVGNTGAVVPPKDPEALAAGWSAMAKRLEDDPKVRGDACTRIETQFSLANLVARTSARLLALL